MMRRCLGSSWRKKIALEKIFLRCVMHRGVGAGAKGARTSGTLSRPTYNSGCMSCIRCNTFNYMLKITLKMTVKNV